MKFGINFFPSFRPEDGTTADYYDQCLRLAARADELGYSSIKTVEHSFYDYGGHSPNPCVFLSAVAARTRRVRLIAGAVIPAFHHPAHLGGDLAMLDNMSKGRLDAGFGRAFLPKEFEVYGVPMSESRERFEEAIGMIRRMWTEERVSQKGRFWSLEDVRLMPRVVQKPHPPVWIAASILATAPDKIVAGGGAFVGTPEDVAAQIRGCVDTFGAIEPSMQINFGGSTDQEAFRTLELFASNVMSKFK